MYLIQLSRFHIPRTRVPFPLSYSQLCSDGGDGGFDDGESDDNDNTGGSVDKGGTVHPPTH